MSVAAQPEVAHAGATSLELLQAGRPFDRYRIGLSELDRAVTDDAEEGYAEVLTARGSGRIFGVTLVGRDAGEQLAAILVLMSRGVGLGSIGSLVLPYPTRSEYLRRLADAYGRGRLTPWVSALLKWWLRYVR